LPLDFPAQHKKHCKNLPPKEKGIKHASNEPFFIELEEPPAAKRLRVFLREKLAIAGGGKGSLSGEFRAFSAQGEETLEVGQR